MISRKLCACVCPSLQNQTKVANQNFVLEAY